MIGLAIAAVSANSAIPNWWWLQVIITVSYYAIPTMLVHALYKGRDIPFQWMFLVFGGFFVACGLSLQPTDFVKNPVSLAFLPKDRGNSARSHHPLVVNCGDNCCVRCHKLPSGIISTLSKILALLFIR